ncbi:DNA-invertase [Roseibium sp. TrichSKD4]|uniref:recombinase family protein n=1 Tax=Roseibium sp. TrichSKD4 TaxID=744980 RepID=UPI0001E56A5F|nr:recombinase family protein [Roseibium sp. TrichSKD4]EFO32551.1 DNA-invertase [Roseibium sp. TrichSKD4]
MKIGYVRVSSNEQITDRQFKLLVDSCDRIMAETISAKDIQRPVYQETIDLLNEGDTLVISSIDRAFRNTMDALSEADKLRARGVHFQILNLAIDTSNADGRLAYTVIAAVAQHERERISERVQQGQAIAKAKGVHIGRPPVMTPCDIRIAKRKLDNGECTISEIANQFGIHPWTVTRSLRRLEDHK